MKSVPLATLYVSRLSREGGRAYAGNSFNTNSQTLAEKFVRTVTIVCN